MRCAECINAPHSAESRITDAMYPYWQKKDRKAKRRQPQLLAELQVTPDAMLPSINASVQLCNPLHSCTPLPLHRALGGQSSVGCRADQDKLPHNVNWSRVHCMVQEPNGIWSSAPDLLSV